jgi:hypothetical protein
MQSKKVELEGSYQGLVKQEKEIHVGKKVAKLFLFTDEMTVYVERFLDSRKISYKKLVNTSRSQDTRSMDKKVHCVFIH